MVGILSLSHHSLLLPWAGSVQRDPTVKSSAPVQSASLTLLLETISIPSEWIAQLVLQRANRFLAVIVFLGSEMISRKEKENKNFTRRVPEDNVCPKSGVISVTNINHLPLVPISVSQDVFMESPVYDIEVLRQIESLRSNVNSGQHCIK